MGIIATLERWTRLHAGIRQCATAFESLCEEMEAAAIALTCASHDIPCIAIKDISNNELLRTTGDEFASETAGQLGRRAAALVLAILQSLAAETACG
jgi:nucleoside phosphorylase